MKAGSVGRGAVLGTMVALSACGGGSGSPTGPTASPSTPTQTVRLVLGTSNFELRPNAATFKSFDNPPNGTMDATLDWTNVGNAGMKFYATDGRCPGFVDLQAGHCTVLARSEGTDKPKRVTFSNTTANAVYIFWIFNGGSTTESGVMEIGVTTTQPINQPPATSSPTPSPGGGTDPRAGLPVGPVTQAKIAIRSIDQGGFDYRDPTQDSAGNWVVYPGEFVVFDLSQRNGAGEKCQWIKDPEWTIEDEDEIVSVRGSSQPFLLRLDILHKGFFELQGHIDGIDSNVLSIVSVAHGTQ
jgi:hypothetical protein